jgi:type III pantothenate kinase
LRQSHCNFVNHLSSLERMILTLDIGNTLTKFAIWDQGNLVSNGQTDSENPELEMDCSDVEWIAISDTANTGQSEFTNFSGKIFQLSPGVKLPFTSAYKTPATLGQDRMAALAGAVKLYPHTDLLVIDAGTCITADVLTKEAVFQGGSISPGLTMRYRSLNSFTGKLPLIEHQEPMELLGKSTEESIISGVGYGVLGELNYRIHNLLKIYPNISVLLTGGDADFLANHLKYRIFAEPLLVHHGLLHCLTLNEF